MKGQCLCGAIQVNAGDRSDIGLCHCSMCRNWGGGPFLAVHCGKEVKFTGIEPKTYQSSDWAKRGFCPECGTHLFYHLLPKDEYMLAAGLFPSQMFSITSQMYTDEKPNYYDFKNETKINMTSDDVKALFKSLFEK